MDEIAVLIENDDGLDFACDLAERGHAVVCFRVSSATIAATGIPGLRFATDWKDAIADADAVILCLGGSPTTYRNLNQATYEIARFMTRRMTIALPTNVPEAWHPIETTLRLTAEHSAYVCGIPEFLRSLAS